MCDMCMYMNMCMWRMAGSSGHRGGTLGCGEDPEQSEELCCVGSQRRLYMRRGRRFTAAVGSGTTKKILSPGTSAPPIARFDIPAVAGEFRCPAARACPTSPPGQSFRCGGGASDCSSDGGAPLCLQHSSLAYSAACAEDLAACGRSPDVRQRHASISHTISRPSSHLVASAGLSTETCPRPRSSRRRRRPRCSVSS